MQDFQIKKTTKTRALNLFRKLFTIPLFESILVSKTIKNKSTIIQKLIPPNYLYSKDSFRYITRNSIKYKLDISNVVDHYLYYGIEEEGYNSIIEDIKKSNVILDIGANIGTTSLFFAHQNSKAQIISFEPHPESYKRALENINLNNYRNIVLLNMGLGDKKESLKLYEVNRNNPGMNRILAEEMKFPFKLIDIEILDNVLAERGINKVDFIKIDVEGFEYAVLQGARTTLSNHPIIFMELDDNYLKDNNRTAKEVIELLISNGYTKFFRADNLAPITIDSNFSNCHYDLIVKG